VEVEDGVLVLKRIRVTYHLRGCPEEKRPAAERAHAFHARKCPVAVSLSGAIAVSTQLVFQ
jgi:uncharacterized OsmC-like protein